MNKINIQKDRISKKNVIENKMFRINYKDMLT